MLGLRVVVVGAFVVALSCDPQSCSWNPIGTLIGLAAGVALARGVRA